MADASLKCSDCGKVCRSRAGLTLHRKRCALAAASSAPPPPPPPQHFVPVADPSNTVPDAVLESFSPSAPRMSLTFAGSAVTAAACSWCGRPFGSVIGCSQHQRKAHKELYLRALEWASSSSASSRPVTKPVPAADPPVVRRSARNADPVTGPMPAADPPVVRRSARNAPAAPSVAPPAAPSVAPPAAPSVAPPAAPSVAPPTVPPVAPPTVLPVAPPTVPPVAPPTVLPAPLATVPPAVATSDLDGPLRAAIKEGTKMVPRGSPLAPLLASVVGALDGGRVVVEVIQPWLLERHPVVWRPRKPPAPTPRPKNKREANRLRRAAMQDLWRRRRKDAARMALDGLTPGPSATKLPPQMQDFWSSLLTAPSTPDARPVHPPSKTLDSLVAPVSPMEILAALRVNGKTSPGPDKLSASVLRSWTIPGLAVLLNCFLLEERLPSTLQSGRVTFIPKVPTPTAPSQFRPITVASMLVRVFHRVLATRFASVVALDPLQFAFQARDGVLEATSALHAALVEAKSRRGLAAACLDLQKAFDSVSTHTILRVARRAGLPEKLLTYLGEVYTSTSVQVVDALVTPTRGVRQGDPLSPLLFNLVIQEILENSRPDLSIRLFGEDVPFLAYADDVFLFAASADDLRLKTDAFAQAAQKAGLRINLEKSFVLVRPPNDPRIIGSSPLPVAGGGEIRALSPSEAFNYLGVRFTPDGLADTVAFDAFRLGLRHLDSSGLTVGQKLCVLRDFLIPRSLHRLYFERTSRLVLRRFDTAMRHAVRRWLRMPEDTPLGAFHASVASGGLGLPSYLSRIPLLRRARLLKLETAEWPFLRAVGAFLADSAIHTIARAPVKVRSRAVESKMELQQAWKEDLAASRDGKALAADLPTPSVHFLRDPSRCFPRTLIDAVHIRFNAVPCRARASRGARRTDVKCRRCSEPLESTAHIVQRCPVTHAARVSRHDRIVARLARALERQQYKVLREPQIPVGPSFVQPDILAWPGSGPPTVIDVQVCGDENAELSYTTKVTKYRTHDVAILRFAHAAGAPLSSSSVSHFPAIFSFRGIVHPSSVQFLCLLGVSVTDLSDCCVLALSGSAKASAVFFCGT